MKTDPPRRIAPGSLAALALFALFAACILTVLLSGAGAYRRLNARDQAAFQRRTCAQYIATRIRQAGAPDAIATGQQEGTPLLAIAEPGGLVTYLYCYQGWLCELYTFRGGSTTLQDGECLLELEAIAFTLEDGLLTASLTLPDGNETTLLFALQDATGGAT